MNIQADEKMKNHIYIKNDLEKPFGILFSVVFLMIALSPLISSGGIRIWSLFISAIFLLLAYATPKIFSIPTKLWIKLGILLGSITAPIVIMCVYFSTVVPTGLIIRFLFLRLFLNLSIVN